jgi:paraquat-inducible protein A
VPELAICAYCDTVHQRVPLPGRRPAHCVTCDAVLYHAEPDLRAMLAATVTAAMGFMIAFQFPLVTLTSGALQTEATLWRSISVAYVRDQPYVALTLAATLLIAPLLEILLLLWVLVPLRFRRRPLLFGLAMRGLHLLQPWRLVEVFLLGVLVAVVKLAGLASSTPGYGIFGIAVMTIAFASLGTIDRGALWRRAEQLS